MAVQPEIIGVKPVGIITVPAMTLPTEDGEPLETSWHRSEINLLIEMIRGHWRGRHDFYAGGNMFIYYSLAQARNRDYRGPDFFVARGVDGSFSREAWVVWEEGGKYPDVIVELLSPSTAREDVTTKKELYEQIFRTPEYFCYDPNTRDLKGWRLLGMGYKEIAPSERGWLWSQQLGVWLGLWDGRYLEEPSTWLRFFDVTGDVVPTYGELAHQQAEQESQARRQAEAQAEQESQARRQAEAQAEQESQARRQAEARAEQEHQRAKQEHEQAEQERQRAERAEAELAQLRERLQKQGVVLEEDSRRSPN